MDEKGILLSDRTSGEDELVKKRKQFAKEFDDSVKKRSMRRSDVAHLLGIDAERFRKIVNGSAPAKKRDCIIAIGFALGYRSGETSDLLNLYNMPSLDDGFDRESAICTALDEWAEVPHSLDEVNERLIKEGYAPLEVINHRRSTRAVNPVMSMPLKQYIVGAVRVICRMDEAFLGDEYDSLSLQYSPDRYKVIVKASLVEPQSNIIHELTVSPRGHFSRMERSSNGVRFFTYSSPESPGEFCYYFERAYSIAKSELRKHLKVLNDTKNYYCRTSARVINNCLHIFSETFNFLVPELNEYCFLDFYDGGYHFSISHESRFMEMYLGKEAYKKIYGGEKAPNKYVFDSRPALEDHVRSDKGYDSRAVKSKWLSAFDELKVKIDDIERHLNVDVFIIHPNWIDRNDTDLRAVYKVGDELPPGLEKKDLVYGYCMGLMTLSEIHEFKMKYGYTYFRRLPG